MKPKKDVLISTERVLFVKYSCKKPNILTALRLTTCCYIINVFTLADTNLKLILLSSFSSPKV